VNGEDIRREPIEDRKGRLAGLLRLPHQGIALNEHYREEGSLKGRKRGKPRNRTACPRLIGRVSIRNRHRLTQACECEFLRRHGLCEQKALDHIKVHLAHGEEVGAGLYALGDRAAAKAVRDIEDLSACGPLQAAIRIGS
jgi:hypothetical protein